MQSLFKRHAHFVIAVLMLCLLGGCSTGMRYICVVPGET